MTQKQTRTTVKHILQCMDEDHLPVVLCRLIAEYAEPQKCYYCACDVPDDMGYYRSPLLCSEYCLVRLRKVQFEWYLVEQNSNLQLVCRPFLREVAHHPMHSTEMTFRKGDGTWNVTMFRHSGVIRDEAEKLMERVIGGRRVPSEHVRWGHGITCW
jgi:hypothetical protein